MDQKTGPL